MLSPPFLKSHDQNLAADLCSRETTRAVLGGQKYATRQADSAGGGSEIHTCMYSDDKGETQKSPEEKQRSRGNLEVKGLLQSIAICESYLDPDS